MILAADVTISPNDSNQLVPMLDAARENLERSVTTRRSSACSPTAATGTTTTSPGSARATTVVIPTRDPHHKGPRKKAPHQGPEADRINKILATAAGKRLYRRRAELVEPVFAHTKHTRADHPL